MEKISFETSDGLTIAGNYWPGDIETLLLLHMMPATKESWNNIATQLSAKGWSVLAIDLRGHGESTQNGRLNYTGFNDSEHQLSIRDVQAAAAWLRLKNCELKGILGASIGANLALKYQVEEGFYGKTVLLSPGFNYHGIQTRALAETLQDPQAVFYAGSKEDRRSEGSSCAEVALELYRLSPIKNKQIFISDGAAHGTDLFEAERGLASQLIKWLS